MLIRPYFIFIIIISFTISPYAQNSDLIINEILASNTTTNLSSYNEYSDWIEIKNTGLSDINISGYFLTDDLSDSAKWQIPANTIIPSNGFLLFWADDRDSGNHTNFKLSRDGESVGLYHSNGTVIDTISFGYQEDDISFGRMHNKISEWRYFEIPTPLAENNSGAVEILPAPQFSIKGGFYNGSQSLILSIENSSAEIRYTIDGTPPDESSSLYNNPIIFDSTTAVRARSFLNGSDPGEIITNTYFINEEINMTIISLVTDPDNFFDDEVGIYVTGTNGIPGDCDPTIRNLNQDWERPVNIELYEITGEVKINQIAGIKIFGGCSRTRYPQKSFALYARSEYGKGSFNYQLFPEKPIEKFETFLLRSSADDQVYTMFRDALSQITVEQMGNQDYQAYRPATVFINGEYWGIHNIREKLNEHYFAGNFGIETENLNFLERNPYDDWNTIHGNADSYNSMIDYIQSNNMNVVSNYDYVKTQMEIEQYIDYQIGHIYLAEGDWPGNNIKFWKTNSGKYSKWRWINLDMDQCYFRVTRDALSMAADPNCGCFWPNPPWSTLLFRKLLDNDEIKNHFIQRTAYLMNTVFHPQRLNFLIDSIKSLIAPEIPKHIEKWGDKVDPDFNEQGWEPIPTFDSLEQWEENVDFMKEFANLRAEISKQNIIDFFNLSGTAELNNILNIPNAGIIKMNYWQLSDSGHSGTYFKDIPFIVEALPYFGYKFLYWKMGEEEINTKKLEITLIENLTLTAYFEEEELNDSNLVIINEINYNSSDIFDSGDWIEFYNRNNEPVNISNWYFKDEDDEHIFTFPEGTEIEGNGYFVAVNNLNDFNTLYPEVENFIGEFDFGLSSGGEVIRLYSINNILIDSVLYDNNPPWPAEPDGGGATLELKSTELNNDFADNWFAVSDKHGTPGMQNSPITDIEKPDYFIPNEYKLFANYPNPFNPNTTIQYSIPVADAKFTSTTRVILKVYDILGNEIATLVNEEKPAGIYTINYNAAELSSGIYYYRLIAGEFTKSMKMILLK